MTTFQDGGSPDDPPPPPSPGGKATKPHTSASHTRHVNRDPKLYQTHTRCGLVSREEDDTHTSCVLLQGASGEGDVVVGRGGGAWSPLEHVCEGHENTVAIKTVSNYITDAIRDFSMGPGVGPHHSLFEPHAQQFTVCLTPATSLLGTLSPSPGLLFLTRNFSCNRAMFIRFPRECFPIN